MNTFPLTTQGEVNELERNLQVPSFHAKVVSIVRLPGILTPIHATRRTPGDSGRD
jgi:hypothetical protein